MRLVGTSRPPFGGVPKASQQRDKNESGTQVGFVATSHHRFGKSPSLQSMGQNQKGPTSGPGGYITSAAKEGVPNA